MKILVIDDSQVNLDAAKIQLNGYDLTTAESYDRGQELLEDKHDFDVVLVDLLMPASRQHQGREGQKFIGQEMPVGMFLALLAAKNGAKHVAVHSDSDHHAHPASACMDIFNAHETEPTSLAVAGAKIILSNNRNWVDSVNPNNLTEKVEYKLVNDRMAIGEHVRAKNWKKVLNYLLSV